MEIFNRKVLSGSHDLLTAEHWQRPEDETVTIYYNNPVIVYHDMTEEQKKTVFCSFSLCITVSMCNCAYACLTVKTSVFE